MNATVSRIVELLFEDVLMTEETEAIRDEVMNNCQERYATLIADGYTEDDAIGAVVESLKGMDEVLKDYPRTTKVDDSDAFRKESDAFPGIRWDSISALRIQVQSADVEIQPSEDGKTSMELHNGTRTMLCPRVEGNTLVITQEKKEEEPIEIDNGSGTSFWSRLGRAIAKSVVTIGDTDAYAVLHFPAGLLHSASIQTLSGDITMNVPCETIALQSTSGDVDVNVDKKPFICEKLTAQSISGDVDVIGSFRQAVLTSTSGDVDFSGAAEGLSISTVSGDANADVEGSSVKANSVSGDLEVNLRCRDSAEAQLTTVSGDAHIMFPDHVKAVCPKISTRSGSVEYHNIGIFDDAPVKVRCTSVSGDINIG